VAFVDRLGRPPSDERRGCDLGAHVCMLELDRLELTNGKVELLAFAGVLRRRAYGDVGNSGAPCRNASRSTSSPDSADCRL
jgi:hypothetical protein